MTEPLPAAERVEIIRADAAGYRVFVETGTADGYTTAALLDAFARLYTIELDPDFYLASMRRFALEPKVLTIHGDSSSVLPELLHVMHEPAVYWLDAHWSGGPTRGPVDTPIVAELAEILKHGRPDTILIDDARLFGTDPAYPTVADLELIAGRYAVVADDIIRFYPGDDG